MFGLEKEKYVKRANQDGAVLITALLMLVVLSIMSAFAMTIANLEKKITKNSEIFQHNFYVVEATTLEAAAKIEEADDVNELKYQNLNWLISEDSLTVDITKSSQWPNSDFKTVETSQDSDPTNLLPPGYISDTTSSGDRIWHAAVDTGTCAGASLTDPDKDERCYKVYGMYDVKRGAGKTYTGRQMMMVGYKKVLYF